MRGFGSGLLWGGVLSAFGLVIVSEMTPMPDVQAMRGAGLVGPEGVVPAPEPAETVDDPAPVVEPEAEREPEPAPAAVEPVTPVAPSAPEAPLAETPPVDAPDSAGVEVPAGSEFSRPLPEVDPTLPQASVAPSRAVAPVVLPPREGRSLPATDTSPTAPRAALSGPAAPASPDEGASAPALAKQPGAVATQDAGRVPGAPEGEAAPASADLPPPPPLTPEEQAVADGQPDPATDSAPAPEVTLLPLDPPMVATAPAGLNARPSAGFAGQVDGVRTDRLPRIGDAAPVEAQDAPDPAALPPIERFARDFANPDGKPAFAIVLIDRGAPGLPRDRLAALPFPVTFALDPTLPDVAARAAPYLAAGQEVVMLATGIPEGATAADLEVTFGAHDAALPQAVAVLDLADDAGFQGNRPMATQVVPIVQAQGRGLLTYDAGLNAADQVASREGLRAATIFRRIDAGGDPAAIRRVLDRAVFKAAQDGRVAVIGEASDATVAALLEWTIEGRASGVALAPVTAVLVAR